MQEKPKYLYHGSPYRFDVIEPQQASGRRDFTCQDGKTNLIYGSLNPRGVGYVYKIKSDTFEKIDGWQWISKERCIPVEIKEIRVEDYIHTVEFSEEAKEINRLLFGE